MILCLVPFAIVAILAVAPVTAPTVQTTLRLLTGKEINGLRYDAATTEQNEEITAAAPGDFGVHLAAALEQSAPAADGGTVPQPVPALQRLQPTFGDQPALQATIVRFLCRGSFQVDRTEGSLLEAAPSSYAASPPNAASQRAVAAGEAAAVQGEAADPNNGFFPAMEAVALLDQRRDDEAVAALHRAAAAPQWNDYVMEEIRAHWKMLRLRTGGDAGLPMLMTADATLLPHFATLRVLARTMIGIAVEDELAGRAESGFAIRRDVARLGALMRVDSPTIIGSLVGIAITNIAAARPGGAPVPDASVTSTRRSSLLASRYVAYLRHIGHPEEADWWMRERAAGDTERAVFKVGLPQFDGGASDIVRLGAWWLAGAILLANAFWLIVCGGIARLAFRIPSVRAGTGLPVGVRAGLLLAVAIPLAGALARVTLLGDDAGRVGARICASGRRASPAWRW
jgi:hypothetical protein